METKTNRKRLTITAEDNIGREESITLLINEATAERIKKTDKGTEDVEINWMREHTRYMLLNRKSPKYFTESQYKRLNEFEKLIFHKFYNYSLTVDIE